MNITPPPVRYEGRFSEFYERYIEPNLPSVDSVHSFDARLRQHLSEEDPVHVVRYVSGQTRGTICRTGDGWKILPTDNAPVWWAHAMLHSGDALPEYNSALFSEMPYHFFKVARFQTLNQAGYHAAHILSAKNRDTDWQSWTRAELARRMLVNIHPCNVFLIAKSKWRQNGGRSDIVAWVTNAYLRRYGSTMERFLADGDQGASLPSGPVDDPLYDYIDTPEATTHHTRPTSAQRTPRRTSPRPGGGVARRTNRPRIWRDLVGKEASLDIIIDGARYLLPHDDLVSWVREHSTALETASWRERGTYSWPRASTAMLHLLQRYKVPY